MRGRATGVVLPALVVLGLVAVVAVTATGSTPIRSTASRPPSEIFLDGFLTLGMLGVVLGAAMFLYGLTQRQAIAREIASGRYRRTSPVMFLAFAVLFAAATYWRLRTWKPTPPDDEEIVIGPRGRRLPTQPEGTESAYEPSISWITVALVSALVLTAVVAYVASLRRARATRAADELLVHDLAAALDDALDDIRSEADARRAVIATYARLERVLAAHGLARLASETADEYVVRVLSDLAIDSTAIERLTRLFAEAKFSTHRIDAAMKDEAIDALVTARNELRSMVEQRAASVEPVVAGA